MNKAWGWLVLAAALGGCGGEQVRQMKAEVTLSDTGRLTVACKQSSSGECHALVLGTTLVRGVAKAGADTAIDGVIPGVRFCVGEVAPEPDKCGPKELAVGTTIFSHRKAVKN